MNIDHPFFESGNLDFRVIVLRTGERILCSMRPQQNVNWKAQGNTIVPRHITIIEPAILVSLETVDGYTTRIRPWMNMSESDCFDIPEDMILTSGDMRSDIRKFYKEYVTEIAKTKQEMREHREKVTINDDVEEKMERSILNLLSDISPYPPRFIDE